MTRKPGRKLVFRHFLNFKFVFGTCVFDGAVRFNLGQNERAAVLPETDQWAMTLRYVVDRDTTKTGDIADLAQNAHHFRR